MPLGVLLIRCFRIVNDRDESVAIPPKVKYHISLNIIRIVECAANLRKIVPSNLFDDSHPCLDLVRRIRVRLHSAREPALS
jgi:hypothetical protein